MDTDLTATSTTKRSAGPKLLRGWVSTKYSTRILHKVHHKYSLKVRLNRSIHIPMIPLTHPAPSEAILSWQRRS